ncbi:hypothetical protein Pcinc_033235 [Petrolisthes cinctipes]|uniref:Uncharacterized protein n=1 Tax=Petrolisthes cinctipes TaxID=88211 RepID=A0AAE1EST8_PETCI|nr:hypothetical protein Pcinc_038042 [Petrolisthes cinctipes]KAK3860732.1 hypothetical protein Pcinc_033235 [Petrolisthes cinctipes]
MEENDHERQVEEQEHESLVEEQEHEGQPEEEVEEHEGEVESEGTQADQAKKSSVLPLVNVDSKKVVQVFVTGHGYGSCGANTSTSVPSGIGSAPIRAPVSIIPLDKNPLKSHSKKRHHKKHYIKKHHPKKHHRRHHRHDCCCKEN